MLGPKMKSPVGVDADGLKRVDGKALLVHRAWWKIIPFVSVDIYQVGEDFLLPVSLIRPVADMHFGEYEIVKDEVWGVEMAYVTGVIRDKKKIVTHYVTDRYGVITRGEGIKLTSDNKLDNVIVVGGSYSTFLRAKPNMIIKDNIG